MKKQQNTTEQLHITVNPMHLLVNTLQEQLQEYKQRLDNIEKNM